MKHIEKEDIPDLAARIPFEQLSEQEQEQVLLLLGDKETYVSFTQAAEQSRELFLKELNEQPLPQKAPALLHSALQRRSRISVSLLFRPIPLYQTGLALAATVACIFFMLPEQKPTETSVATIIPSQPTIIVQAINKDSLVSFIRDSLHYVLQSKDDTRKEKYSSPQYIYNSDSILSEKIAYNDTTEEKQSTVKQKNPFVGLDNMDIILSQKKGISSYENGTIPKFTYQPKGRALR